MDVISTTRYAKVSPKKVHDVAREIQGLPVEVALDVLNYTPKKSALLIGKTLRTAIADAENNFNLNVDELTIKEATIGDGPVAKRHMARARGSASPVIKRTSHIRIVLTDSK